MTLLTNLLIVTQIPSPYQVELFDALAARGVVTPQVVYLQRRLVGRQWPDPPKQHDHIFVGDPGADVTLTQWRDNATLVVVGDYTYTVSQRLLQSFERSQQPWCFWGERPGSRQLAKLGVWYRRWRLGALHRRHAPIWGIGRWAIEGYQREFGDQRLYCNVPYSSNLDRFRRSSARATDQTGCRFLFSGSLIARKGADLLAQAFARLATESDVTLTWLGAGELEARLRTILAPCARRVSWAGFQPWEALPAYYHAADVLCVPSRYDGWGLVVAEGLAAGLPVIASDRTGAALDLIRPAHNGWLVPAGDVEALYQALKRAAAQEVGQRSALAHQAAESIHGHGLLDGAARFEQAAADSLAYWAAGCSPVSRA